MGYAIPLEIFASLENKLGKDDALKVSRAIEQSVQIVQQRADEIAEVKKAEIKNELEKELSTKLATKADTALLSSEIAQLEAKINAKFALVDAKADKRFYLTLAAIVILNPHAIELLSKLLGLAK